MADEAASSSKGWNVGIWVVQALLALVFVTIGVLRTTLSVDTLVDMGVVYADDLPLPLLRFIGVVELLGGLGVIVPALSRVKPMLTPLAATGLALLMVLASVFHATRSEWEVLPTVLLLATLAAFVIWGRTRKVRIEPRS